MECKKVKVLCQGGYGSIPATRISCEALAHLNDKGHFMKDALEMTVEF